MQKKIVPHPNDQGISLASKLDAKAVAPYTLLGRSRACQRVRSLKVLKIPRFMNTVRDIRQKTAWKGGNADGPGGTNRMRKTAKSRFCIETIEFPSWKKARPIMRGTTTAVKSFV